MAFNYRPESSAEIFEKNKKNAGEAALIYEAVMDKYGEEDEPSCHDVQ